MGIIELQKSKIGGDQKSEEMSQQMNEIDTMNNNFDCEGIDSPSISEQLLSPTSKLKISPPKDLNKKQVQIKK